MPIYTLALASHKGGSGTTTAAAAVSWLLGQQGYRVALVDVHPAGSVRLLAETQAGVCPWPNVSVHDYREYENGFDLDTDLVVLDCPPLTEQAALPALELVDGLVLSCRADLLSLRTLSAVQKFLEKAEQQIPNLSFLGTIINLFDREDTKQQQLFANLLDSQGDLLIRPPVAWQESLCDWALSPGSPLPEGSGTTAYEIIVDIVLELSGIQELTSTSV